MLSSRSAAELREMAVKNAALEAKQVMQAEIGALHVERRYQALGDAMGRIYRIGGSAAR